MIFAFSSIPSAFCDREDLEILPDDFKERRRIENQRDGMIEDDGKRIKRRVPAEFLPFRLHDLAGQVAGDSGVGEELMKLDGPIALLSGELPEEMMPRR